jgi:hypothetical protein
MSSTGRPSWQRSLPVLTALALAVMVAHLVLFGIGVAVIGGAGGYLTPAALPILAVDVMILVGAACLGVAAGRSWPSRVLPPLSPELPTPLRAFSSSSQNRMQGDMATAMRRRTRS